MKEQWRPLKSRGTRRKKRAKSCSFSVALSYSPTFTRLFALSKRRPPGRGPNGNWSVLDYWSSKKRSKNVPIWKINKPLVFVQSPLFKLFFFSVSDQSQWCFTDKLALSVAKPVIEGLLTKCRVLQRPHHKSNLSLAGCCTQAGC